MPPTGGTHGIHAIPTLCSCVPGRHWRDMLTAAGMIHKDTWPYRPQTNGRVERFNRTLLNE